MADLKRGARKAVEGLDLNVDLGQLRGRLPDNIDWHFIRQREDEAASRGFFAGLFLGAVVGAVLALIFAPQRGEDTRGLVLEKATDLVHQVRGDSNEASTDLTGQEPAIEREFGQTTDTVLVEAEGRLDEPQTRY
ncbi:MAG: YtxH domain-containing protein [Chloroflexota bacterium]|nr:YtxH domain-containing protein [Chloroflexota bacterium]